jgi:hypothetical protein
MKRFNWTWPTALSSNNGLPIVQPLRCHRRSFDFHGKGERAEACRLATLSAQTPDFRRQHGEHPMNEQDEWPYWKAAISCLPSQEMRDAAWEFFVRHLAQNPKMADSFSGVILVTQANGLYMLKVPKLVHDEALLPLGREVSRLRDEKVRDGQPPRRTHDRYLRGLREDPASREGRGHGRKGTRRYNPRRLARSEY